MKMQLLVDAPDFWRALAQDIRSATASVHVQAMTFEGDAAGLALADALIARPDLERCVLVDSFTRMFQSDRFMYSPAGLFNPELRAEQRSTGTMMTAMIGSGVDVHFTNPPGAMLQRIAARNHKKLIIVDRRIAYIGGINFSDHNYAWHDTMLRIECADTAEFLLQDFRNTRANCPAYAKAQFQGIEMHCLDGRTNAGAFDRLRLLIEDARDAIVVHSPYLTFPVCGWLRAAARRGVHVTIISSAHNNRGFLRHYITWESRRSGFDLRLYPGMTHVKAMLVDGASLVLGSTNFDYLSFSMHDEIFGIVTDSALIEEFNCNVLLPDLRKAMAVGPAGVILSGAKDQAARPKELTPTTSFGL